MAGKHDALSFWVDGPVRGAQRPKVTRHGTYTPRETREARARVVAAVEAGMPEGAPRPLFAAHEPVAVAITTFRPLPKSRPRAVEAEADTYKPDADNIAKLVLDALNGIAYVDDAQVTSLSVTKTARTRLSRSQTLVQVWQDPVGMLDARTEVRADAPGLAGEVAADA